MKIRTASDADAPKIRAVILAAFDASEREEVAELVANLTADRTARPLKALVAEADDGGIVGYVLFTSVKIAGAGPSPRAMILAPLAVAPGFQGRGIGGALIEEGLNRLREAGVALVFVLGHPGYYPRFGFRPAGALGLEAPYPILPKNAAAWMVQQLQNGVLGRVTGRVQCADSMSRPEYWQE